MNVCPNFAADCPSRLLFDQLTDKWSAMVLTLLATGPMRFNALKRQIGGITQKALTQCLRRLERNGMVSRRVIPGSPVAVEYEVSPLGRSLQKPMEALYTWILAHLDEVENARVEYEAQSAVA